MSCYQLFTVFGVLTSLLMFCGCRLTPQMPIQSAGTNVASTQIEKPSNILTGEELGTKSHHVYLEEQSDLFDRVHIATDHIYYEPIKLIFIRTEEDADSAAGPYLTYLELLQKAEKLGAHDIINVRIERTENCVKTKRKEPECKNIRFGSALAVRYTNPLTPKDFEPSSTCCTSSTCCSEN